MNKFEKKAPLPFQGQKRNFATRFSKVIKEMNEKEKIGIVVDLFGGSGLLSHVASQTLPEAQIIYNDFDDYHIRLQNIDRTNLLLNDIRTIVGISKNGKKIDLPLKKEIIAKIKEYEETGFVDYITLSASLLFSAKYVINLEQLEKEGFYNNIKHSDYSNAADYLRGIDVLKQDYKVLVERYKNRSDVLFVVDPPYLSTDTSTYSSDKYWKLADYLDVLKVINNVNYIYFTSNKSAVIELYEWISQCYGVENPFLNANLYTQDTTLNKTSKYTDMMFFKKR